MNLSPVGTLPRRRPYRRRASIHHHPRARDRGNRCAVALNLYSLVMRLVAAGLSFRTAPLAVREAAAIPAARAATTLRYLVGHAGLLGAAVLSTCNRTDFYMVCPDELSARGGAAAGSIPGPGRRPRMSNATWSRPSTAMPRCTCSGWPAVSRAWSSARRRSSGQFKAAHRVATEAGTVDARLDYVMRRAISTAKRVRTDTALGRGSASLSEVAVDCARSAVEDLDGKGVLLVGAGKMSRLAARRLRDEGARIMTTSRGESSRRLARTIGGEPVALDASSEVADQVDVIIASTDSARVVLDAAGDRRAPATARRNGRSASSTWRSLATSTRQPLPSPASPSSISMSSGAVSSSGSTSAARPSRRRSGSSTSSSSAPSRRSASATPPDPAITALVEWAEALRSPRDRREPSGRRVTRCGDARARRRAHAEHGAQAPARAGDATPRGGRGPGGDAGDPRGVPARSLMPAADTSLLRLATRGSALARAQAALAADALLASGGVEIETVIVRTEGDRRDRRPIDQLDGQGWFTAELERSLLDGRADVAVHSGKDLPSTLAAGSERRRAISRGPIRATASCRAGDRTLAAAAAGSTVGTSSARRAGSACRRCTRACAPVAIRGNVDTRLRKLDAGEFDALVLACAGLDRLGLGDRCSERLDPVDVRPVAGSGSDRARGRDRLCGRAAVRGRRGSRHDRGGHRRARGARRPRRRVPAPARRVGADRGRAADPRRGAGRRTGPFAAPRRRAASTTRRRSARWSRPACDERRSTAARRPAHRRDPNARAGRGTRRSAARAWCDRRRRAR